MQSTSVGQLRDTSQILNGVALTAYIVVFDTIPDVDIQQYSWKNCTKQVKYEEAAENAAAAAIAIAPRCIHCR